MAEKKSVWAKQARWKHEEKNGEITGFIGSFTRDCGAAALGTLKHLKHKKIVSDDMRLETYSNCYIIHLRSDKGDNLAKFQEWAMKHNLLPQLEAKLIEQEHEALHREYEQERLSSYAYPPLTGAEAKALISALHWQAIDMPGIIKSYPLGTKKKDRDTTEKVISPKGYLVVNINDPKTAFQVAYYLCKKGMIPQKSFDRLNEEINHSVITHETDPDFRIAVSNKHWQKFDKRFTTDDTPDSQSNKR